MHEQDFKAAKTIQQFVKSYLVRKSYRKRVAEGVALSIIDDILNNVDEDFKSWKPVFKHSKGNAHSKKKPKQQDAQKPKNRRARGQLSERPDNQHKPLMRNLGDYLVQSNMPKLPQISNAPTHSSPASVTRPASTTTASKTKPASKTRSASTHNMPASTHNMPASTTPASKTRPASTNNTEPAATNRYAVNQSPSTKRNASRNPKRFKTYMCTACQEQFDTADQLIEHVDWYASQIAAQSEAQKATADAQALADNERALLAARAHAIVDENDARAPTLVAGQANKEPNEATESIVAVMRAIGVSSYIDKQAAIAALRDAARALEKLIKLITTAEFTEQQLVEILRTPEVMKEIAAASRNKTNIQDVLKLIPRKMHSIPEEEEAPEQHIVLNPETITDLKIEIAIAALEAHNKEQKEAAEEFEKRHDDERTAQTHLKHHKKELDAEDLKAKKHTMMHDDLEEARKSDQNRREQAVQKQNRFVFDSRQEEFYKAQLEDLLNLYLGHTDDAAADIDFIQNHLTVLMETQKGNYAQTQDDNGNQFQTGDYYYQSSYVFIEDINISLYVDEDEQSMGDFIINAIVEMHNQSILQLNWLQNQLSSLRREPQPRVDHWIRQFLSENRERTAANYDPAAEGENLAAGGRTDRRGGKARARQTNDKERANQSNDRKSGAAIQDQMHEGQLEAAQQEDYQAADNQHYNNHLKLPTP